MNSTPIAIDPKIHGWKSIAAALGKAVGTTRDYARRDKERNRLRVEKDMDGLYARQSWIDDWKAAEVRTNDELVARWKKRTAA